MAETETETVTGKGPCAECGKRLGEQDEKIGQLEATVRSLGRLVAVTAIVVALAYYALRSEAKE